MWRGAETKCHETKNRPKKKQLLTVIEKSLQCEHRFVASASTFWGIFGRCVTVIQLTVGICQYRAQRPSRLQPPLQVTRLCDKGGGCVATHEKATTVVYMLSHSHSPPPPARHSKKAGV